MPLAAGALGIHIEREVAIPMRDGVILRANLFRPDGPGPFPALVHRTPYGKAVGGMEDFIRAGYAVLSQDTRGRYTSEGTFSLFTVPYTHDGEDGYDTVEWAAAQSWCTGDVGTFGASYDAWMQYACARLRPPHLGAMSAISIPLELTDLDWPGAFKPARRVRWWFTTIAPDIRRREGLPPPHTKEEAVRIWEEVEHHSKLGVVPWTALIPYLPSSIARQVDAWLRHPDQQPWKFSQSHAEISVPNLDFTGWFDHCCSIDQTRGLQMFGRGEAVRDGSRVVIGPWNHVNLGKRLQGAFDFGANAEVSIRQMQIRWFDYWLKAVENGIEEEPAVRYYVLGAGIWRTADVFPPPIFGRRALYLTSEGDAPDPEGTGELARSPRLDVAADLYTYDPLDPVPTLWDQNLFYGVADRRQLDYRSDILHFRTQPLKADMEIVGKPQVILYASSSALDTDFFVRLIDDDPDGPAMEVCYGFVRARYRNGLDQEELLEPGEIYKYTVDLGYTACRFRQGHRIRLDVCSSDFPNHDRNHNTGMNDLTDAEMVPARQIIFHSIEYPSCVLLPIALPDNLSK